MIVNAEVIKPVSTSLVKTLVKMLVESVLNAKLSIMVRIFVQFSNVSSNFSIWSFFQVRSVLVPMDTWVTRLQHAELPEIHPRLSNKDQPTPESLDCPDSSALLITLLVSFKKHTGKKLK